MSIPPTAISTAPAVVNQLTEEQFKEALPTKMRKAVNPDVLNTINGLLADPDMCEAYRENLLSYSSVMAEGKFKLPAYIDAVKYVSNKIRGLTNQRAYEISFPNKIQDWVTRGVEAKDIASYISSYHRGKLVQLVMAQTLTPVHILNMDMYQHALNVQAELMVHANSEMVRTTAANSLLTQLKPPETQKVELDVGIKKDSSIAVLAEATMKLAAQQRLLIDSGTSSVLDVAQSNVVLEGTAEDITND